MYEASLGNEIIAANCLTVSNPYLPDASDPSLHDASYDGCPMCPMCDLATLCQTMSDPFIPCLAIDLKLKH